MTSILSIAGGRPVLEAAVVRFLNGPGHGGHPLRWQAAFADARRRMVILQDQALPDGECTTEDITLPVGPTGFVQIRLYRPASQGEASPAILYLHGGFWVMGGKATHDRLMRELVAQTNAAIVFVEYALAPDARYPVQNEQAYAALLYLADNAVRLRLDAARIAVVGDCAGGNMAAAITLLAKRRRGPDIALQVLFYPIMGVPAARAQHDGSSCDPWLSDDILPRCLDAYLPSGPARHGQTAFPLDADILTLNDLPRALVIVAECDILRDDGEAYARKLTEAGVVATCTRYVGTIHDFLVLDALAGSASSKSAVAQASEAIRRAFYLE